MVWYGMVTGISFLCVCVCVLISFEITVLEFVRGIFFVCVLSLEITVPSMVWHGDWIPLFVCIVIA